MSVKLIFDLSLFFFEKSSCIFTTFPTSFVAVLLLLLSLPLWSSQYDDAQIQMKFNVILYPFKVQGQCLVPLQNDVLKNAEHYSQFAFLLLLLKHEFRPL